MSCLTDSQCSRIRDTLITEGTDEAVRYWDTHADTIRALTLGELRAFAQHRNPRQRSQALLNAWRIEAERLAQAGDNTLHEAWMAERRQTTEGLTSLALRRYQVRRLLLEAGGSALGVVLRVLRAVLGP